MNLKQQSKIKDMASPYANRIKARGTRRDEDNRQQHEALEKQNVVLFNYLQDKGKKLLPTITMVWDIINEMYQNGFGDDVVAEMKVLDKKYHIYTDTDEEPDGNPTYLNYYMPLDDDGKEQFCIGLWMDWGDRIGFAYVDDYIDEHWLDEGSDNDIELFNNKFRFEIETLGVIIDRYVDYFNEFISWVESEFPEVDE